jgi:uncharacterized protein YjaG (DUF416 family)
MDSFLDFSEEHLLKEIGALPTLAHVGFAAACASRLLPSYEELSMQSDDVNVALLRCALKQTWEFALGDSEPSLEEIASRLIELIPPENDCRTLAAGVADDALAAAAYAALSTISDSPQNSVWAARRAYELTVWFADWSMKGTAYTPDISRALRENRFVQTELDRQLRDIQTLTKAERSELGASISAIKSRAEFERALPPLLEPLR